MGLVEGDVDLFDESNKLRGAGVLGYYSYDDERIRVRGTELTPAVRVDARARADPRPPGPALRPRQAVRGPREGRRLGGRATASDALVEGDARRIENEWREGLPEAERAALDKVEAKQAKGFEAEAADIPEVLKTLMTAPVRAR